MKRKTLLIAIAAVAAVGIAVGILASGVAGPLPGSIGPSPTTLTLEQSLDMDPNGPWGGAYLLSLHGRLTDAAGGPVANRWVWVRVWTSADGPGTTDTAGADMTGADGSFEVAYQQPAPYPPDGITYRYRAEFPGDSAYLASWSPYVQGP